MIRAHSGDTPSVTTKRLNGGKTGKSSSRKNYKRLKFKLKGLIEEGVILKETLRKKEEQLVEMSRDIHYILGRLEHQRDNQRDSLEQKESDASKTDHSSIMSDPFDEHQTDIKSESQPSWDGYCVSSVSTLDSKNRINFSLPPEVERQLSSVYPPLTLPDDIFSES